MNKNMIAIAVAAAMESMQHIPSKLATINHRISGNLGFNGIRRDKTKKYHVDTGKYKPHQGKQECARRLRVGSPAWHSGN